MLTVQADKVEVDSSNVDQNIGHHCSSDQVTTAVTVESTRVIIHRHGNHGSTHNGARDNAVHNSSNPVNAPRASPRT